MRRGRLREDEEGRPWEDEEGEDAPESIASARVADFSRSSFSLRTSATHASRKRASSAFFARRIILVPSSTKRFLSATTSRHVSSAAAAALICQRASALPSASLAAATYSAQPRKTLSTAPCCSLRRASLRSNRKQSEAQSGATSGAIWRNLAPSHLHLAEGLGGDAPLLSLGGVRLGR